MDTDQDIERAARRLAETAGSPVRVILFGSHARDDARPGSDLDFLVIEPHVPDRHAEMVRLRSALHDLRRPIDVLVYSDAQVEEWGDALGTALHAALTEGQVLVERDALDVARALLAKAAGDEAGCALADRDDVPDHVAGFLAQQQSRSP